MMLIVPPLFSFTYTVHRFNMEDERENSRMLI